MSSPSEVTLQGGTANRGLVVRVGDTVRRPIRPTSPSTHALLRFLDDAGFDAAPRFLGVDDAGREILTYIPGQAPRAPYEAWALDDEALASVAVLLRRFHEAVRPFPTDGYVWARQVPQAYRGPQVSHNDPNLDNIVFRDGIAVALIDFDLASPGSPTWDLALAVRLWCPLRDEADIHDERRGRSLKRLRLFLDAYEAADSEREQLFDAIISGHQWSYDHVRAEVAKGHEAFTDHWVVNKAEQRARRTWQWYDRMREDLRAAAR
jgi:Ser/Thr protein kinase RdoA (MazF antagonist)